MLSAVQTQHAAWLAQLDLHYAKRGDKTVISQRRHVGPLTIQRPFYPENGTCHTYVLHPPGGVVGGDRLNVNVVVDTDAHALITTPASAKFYRSNGAVAQQRQHLVVAEGGILEWLPQDTILFDACKLNTVTNIQLAAQAKFAGWEILCQGRPASGEKFVKGQCRQVFEIYRQGKPLVIERTALAGNSEMQTAKWGLADYPVMGTMLVTSANPELLSLAREVGADAGILFSATLLKDVLVCRYLGWQGIEARECFSTVWEKIRLAWIGRKTCRPRIWDT